MALQIELPPELAERLEQEATRLGVEPEQIVLQLVEERFRPQTGAELLDYLERNDALGAFQDRPPTREWARQLRQEAETRGRKAS